MSSVPSRSESPSTRSLTARRSLAMVWSSTSRPSISTPPHAAKEQAWSERCRAPLHCSPAMGLASIVCLGGLAEISRASSPSGTSPHVHVPASPATNLASIVAWGLLSVSARASCSASIVALRPLSVHACVWLPSGTSSPKSPPIVSASIVALTSFSVDACALSPSGTLPPAIPSVESASIVALSLFSVEACALSPLGKSPPMHVPVSPAVISA
mmetsp:Transcript_28318/g.70101  ORF Transcript_28318/g.70101 Transcript_28318/m.70101 type:complete len:214 (+) Transcript_28318:545-1186(+)